MFKGPDQRVFFTLLRENPGKQKASVNVAFYFVYICVVNLR